MHQVAALYCFWWLRSVACGPSYFMWLQRPVHTFRQLQPLAKMAHFGKGLHLK